MYCLIFDSSNMVQEKRPKAETFDDLKFTVKCKDNMRRYLYFLYWHHGYKIDKLREVFPEYIEPKQ